MLKSLEIQPITTAYKSQSVVHGILFVDDKKYAVPQTGTTIDFGGGIEPTRLYMHLHAYDRQESDGCYFLVNASAPELDANGKAVMRVRERGPAASFHLVNA